MENIINFQVILGLKNALFLVLLFIFENFEVRQALISSHKKIRLYQEQPPFKSLRNVLNFIDN